MANRIQLRRGIKSKLPTLSSGEPAYTTDTHELFVGTGSSNVNMSGNKWYTGTDMSSTGVSSYSGCPLVKVGDMYLNTSNGYVYECTTAGSGTTAKWTYRCCMRGATGAQGTKGDKGDKGDNASITGAASTITSSNLTANKAVISNSSGKVAASSVTSTELGYLSGVTSSVQTQLDGKLGKNAFSGTGSDSFIAGGSRNTASGGGSFIGGGDNNTAKGTYTAVIAASGCTASTEYSLASGCYNTALDSQVKFGHYATDGTAGFVVSTDGDAFIIGNGMTNTQRSNAFRVSYAGGVYGKSSFNSTGADYAEFFEWLDKNPEDADRAGLFVTLDGDKIRIANADDDYILGIVSAAPCIIGNNHADTWQGMWLTDIFGRVQTHTVHHDAVYDDEGNLIHDAFDAVEPIVNPDYNPDEKYVPREERKEWGIVGMMGQLVVIDDGTCVVNGNCTVSDGGTATASDSGYRVIARLDDTHVKVLFR